MAGRRGLVICVALAAIVAIGADDCESASSSLPSAGGGTEVDGRWTVVGAEFAGNPLTDLQGSELVFARGRKTFRLTSGKVETGEYRLDASSGAFDTTTDGRGRLETGSYRIQGDELSLVLSQGGKSRPTRFETRKGSDLVLLVLRRAGPAAATAGAAASVPSVAKTPPSRSRTFYMGFTGFVPDMTAEAVNGSHKFVREHSDILAHHIEGVPWEAMSEGKGLPKQIVDSWTDKKRHQPPGGKVYVAISPGRGELKQPDGEGWQMPASLKGKAYDDPAVMQAYLNYVRRTIEFFDPDYLAIGIEVNEIYSSGKSKWNAYAKLHRYVYREIKRSHPDLPVSASYTLHNLIDHKGGMLSGAQELMDSNDYVAISFYPFFRPEDPQEALDWFFSKFDRFGKPYAMVETGDTAEPTEFGKYRLYGTEAKQARYFETLLETAERKRFLFVISFCHQDYDNLWKRIEKGAPDLFKAWQDTGLVDENGRERQSYRVWAAWLKLPVRR